MKNKAFKIMALAAAVTMAVSAGGPAHAKGKNTKEAVYLGVENYGAEETNKNNKDSFLYRFRTDDGEETLKVTNGKPDANGNYAYPIQNVLKEGYRYALYVENGTVMGLKEIKDEDDEDAYEPPVAGKPGKKTLLNFLKTAQEPVGAALYVYGGGWNWQNDAASLQARSIGVSPDWVRFFKSQNQRYTYKDPSNPGKSYYPFGGFNEYYYAGLDCSGYVGWTLYNTLEKKDGKAGYVRFADNYAKFLAEKGWGERVQNVQAPDGKAKNVIKPGDIMSMDGHVWISLGTCRDGSVVIAHSTPSASRSGQQGGGVQLSAIGISKNCEAYRLADHFMSENFPKWFKRYPVYLASPSTYFSFKGADSGLFTWDTDGSNGGLTDPDKVQDMEPREVLSLMYDEGDE